MHDTNHHYLGRQPILDKDGDIVAYDLLYADGSKVSSDRYATAAVISSVLNTFGVEPILGRYPAFVRVDRKMLLHDLIFSVPKEFFVLSLLEVNISDRHVGRSRIGIVFELLAEFCQRFVVPTGIRMLLTSMQMRLRTTTDALGSWIPLCHECTPENVLDESNWHVKQNVMHKSCHLNKCLWIRLLTVATRTQLRP